MRYHKLIAIFFIVIIAGCSSNLANKGIETVDSDQGAALFNSKAVTHFIRGMMSEMRGDNKAALIEFNNALLFDSTSATIYQKIAEQYIKLNRYESAEKTLESAIRKHGTNIDLLQLLANIYYRTSKLDATARIYNRIISLEPSVMEHRYNLIAAYMAQQKDLKVAQEYEKLIQMGKGTDDMKIKVANIYLEHSDNDKALNMFANFLKEYPDDERSYLGMAKYYLVTQDTLAAAEWYKKGLEVNAGFKTCFEELNDLYIKQEEWDQSIALIQDFILKDSSDVEMRLKLGQLHYVKNDTVEALRIFNEIIDDFPEDFRPYFSVATIHYSKRDWENAIHYYSETIEKNQDLRRGWMMLGLSLLRSRKIEDAEKHFRESLAIFPDDADFNYFAGTTLNQQQKFRDAVPYLEKCLELDPSHVDAMGALAMAYDETGEYAKSDNMYESALSIREGNPLLMNNYSYSLSERGERLDYALQLSEKAVAQDSTNGAYWDTLGWIYFKKENYEKALKYIRKSIQHSDASSEVYDHLGDVYEKLKDIDNALKYWRKAYELDNTRTEILKKIENLKPEHVQ